MHPYSLLDVFTDTPLCGNQLAVFADGCALDAQRMQRLARELNLSETVFLLERSEPATVSVRIFTPTVELPFAGHPVLGAGIAFATELGAQEVTMKTAAGPVPVRVTRAPETSADANATGSSPTIAVASGAMLQPLPSFSAFEHAPELLAAIGVERSLLPVEVYDNGPRHVCVLLASFAEVAALAPDLRALSSLGAVGVSCFAYEGMRVKTRMFAPALGVGEDPATGSAAGPLALHLCRHGLVAFGSELEIAQGAEVGRPSLLRARVDGSAELLERVEVSGSAVFVGRGEIVGENPPVGEHPVAGE
jgi:trans-2,3-dihydro-3-hydroxyanthranilate isomerase